MWQLSRRFIPRVFIIICVLHFSNLVQAQAGAKDNGDFYMVNETTFLKDKMTTEATTNKIDFDAIMQMCNASFSIPMADLDAYHALGELPDTTDKTGMCYIRCFYEKSGLIDNWKLNADKIRANMWPAMGDSIDVCQQEDKNVENPCVRTYAIAKCLQLRLIVDARNNPVV